MAVTVKNIIPAKQVESAQTTQYTAVNARAVIDKFTVTNTSGGNVLFSANLVPPNSSPATSNRVINNREIAPNESYTCPELVGQVLESGGSISTLAGTASALTMYASGREITA